MKKAADNPLRVIVDGTMQRLERYCAERQGRQTQVARALLVAQSQVSRWVTGETYPRLDTFCALIEFLDQEYHETQKNGPCVLQDDTAQNKLNTTQ